jgi:hypothetical protein
MLKMDELIRDCLEWTRKQRGSILVSPEEWGYFSVRRFVGKSIDKEVKQWVEKVLPQVVIKEEIPQEKRVGVLVLGRGEPMLQKMAQAISERFVPAHLIDIGKEGDWEGLFGKEGLKLVVAPPLHEWQGLALSKSYANGCFGKVSAILMRPQSDYDKDPELKKALWKMISSRLSSSTPP